MAGMKFEYDEEGGTFYYFLLSFIALVLFPATYYLWPRKSSKDEQRKKYLCYCEPCQIKRQKVESNQPRKTFQQYIIKIILIIGWIFFAYIAYKTSQVELDFKEFDPYAELEIDRGAELSDIKKAYRKLSLIYHPDRETGDSHRFMRITKAHDALTDEESRKNWEEYGNPDGPGATQVGIALPKWIVEKQNSIFVLGLYGLIFMIILPVCVGTWWYRSIKYSAQQVLIDTTRLYYGFLRKSPNMILKRIIMVLSGSYEFSKRFNSEIIERPSDNTEIPELIRDLPQFVQNPRELPFFVPYSVKARALLVGHFSRHNLASKSLEYDKEYILKKCPYLLNEMLSLAQQLYFITQNERIPFKLNLDTVENIMKTSQMVIQGLWCNKSLLLQLPHITEDMLRHFVNKKRAIRGIKEFAGMEEEDRRSLLRYVSDREYQNIMNVVAVMPYNVEMEVKCEVRGEDDKSITAGSLVTVTVKLIRHKAIRNEEIFSSQNHNNQVFSGVSNKPGLNDSTYDNINSGGDATLHDNDEDDEADEADDDTNANSQQSKDPSAQQAKSKWTKTKKKKGTTKKSKTKKVGTKLVVIKKANEDETIAAKETQNNNSPYNPPSSKNSPNSDPSSLNMEKKSEQNEDTTDAEDESINNSNNESGTDSETPHNTPISKPKTKNVTKADNKMVTDNKGGSSNGMNKGANIIVEQDGVEGEDEDEWMAFQKEAKKENVLESKSKETHLVHCPYYPIEKYEWWWLYLADTKKKTLISGPLQVTTLKEFEEKDLRFSAPNKPGLFQFAVVLRSDSYLGLDQTVTIKVDVKEARKIVEPKWEFSDDEDKEKSDGDTETDASTDVEVSDYD